jgi:hypothetical protein
MTTALGSIWFRSTNTNNYGSVTALAMVDRDGWNLTNQAFDPWSLDYDAPDWLTHVSTRLLEVGVPPTAISKAFSVELEAVRNLQDTLHTQRYGSAELSEAMTFFMWKMIDDAYETLATAPIHSRTRLMTTMLARASAMVQKSDPEGMSKMRDEFLKLTSSIQSTQTVVPSIYASPEFSPLDGEPDDPEQGSTDRSDQP